MIGRPGGWKPSAAGGGVGSSKDSSARFHAYVSLYRELVTTSDHWRLAFALWPTPYHDEKIQVLGRSIALDLGALHLRPEDAEARSLMSVLQAAITGLAFQYEARGSGSGGVLCAARGSARAGVPPGDDRHGLDHLLGPLRGGAPGAVSAR